MAEKYIELFPPEDEEKKESDPKLKPPVSPEDNLSEEDKKVKERQDAWDKQWKERVRR